MVHGDVGGNGGTSFVHALEGLDSLLVVIYSFVWPQLKSLDNKLGCIILFRRDDRLKDLFWHARQCTPANIATPHVDDLCYMYNASTKVKVSLWGVERPAVWKRWICCSNSESCTLFKRTSTPIQGLSLTVGFSFTAMKDLSRYRLHLNLNTLGLGESDCQRMKDNVKQLAHK